VPVKTFFAGLLLALLTACGGGGAGSGTPGTIQTLGDARPMFYGYYLGCTDYAVEQGGKANLWWAAQACGSGGFGAGWPEAVAASLLAARAAGVAGCAVLHLPDRQVYAGPDAVATVGAYLHRLAATGMLRGWPCLVLYPVDEPDRAGLDDATINTGNAALRAVVADIPELKSAPLAVFYACATGATPGFASFNWVGCDDYNRGCNVTSAWDGYIARMAPGQVLMAISGGYSGARQDPTCFKLWASNQRAPVVLIGFTWQATDAGAGIRDDAKLRPIYESLGRWVLGSGP
jgi:hypothetical protein